MMNFHSARLIGLVVVLCALVSCGGLFLSPRERVIFDAFTAVCKTKDLRSLAPYLTNTSRKTLALANPLLGLTGLFGSNVADQIAIECQTGDGLDFAEEVKVSDSRYIVRTRSKTSGEITEYVVLWERGTWKIALLGK